MGTEYITDAEFTTFGLATGALSRASTGQKDAARRAASAEADGSFRARYTLPLTAWDDLVRMHVAAVATERLLTILGWNPEDPANANITAAARRAREFFRRVGASLEHPDVTETAPVTSTPYVLSDEPQGW